MIHTELVLTSQLSDSFHKFAEQLNGTNTAAIVQSGKKPKSKLAYPLAYFKAYADPNANTGEVKELLGMLQFGMLCAGPEMDMMEVTGFPHGLYCLQGPPNREGVLGVVMVGDGHKWSNAINTAGKSSSPAQEWGVACYQQFAKYNLSELFGTLKPKVGKKPGYFLDLT